MGRRKKLTDRINVVDVESTCWQGDPPDGQVSEIIQVGIAQLDLRRFDAVLCESIYVEPSKSKVGDFCTELTGITQQKVDTHGVPFEAACKILQKEYRASSYPWASWGDYDRRKFEEECSDGGIRYPFGSRHLNVKTLAAMAFGWDGEVGVSVALDRLGIEFEGHPHDGMDDARNIAKVLVHILQKSRA